ncbi:DMT family transporter [Paenibacillus sp. N1-5-1-14]|uniref:DMT family transporter n=1 Tax=Paenibacillus radicibacter TaxID=2972488 RepID=UPI002158F016|nr:DMT family transporter [Paenibacillus radicibacter]MCR8643790.1 DMT family transporter [Paenibacillus radicibacter]
MKFSQLFTKGSNVKLAYLFAVINAVVIGISFMLVKKTLDYASPLDTLTFRFAAAFVILLIVLACGLVKLNYRGKPFYKLLLLASMYPLGYFILQTLGLKSATSAEGGIISAFTPIITMAIASLFLKESTTLLQKLFTFLSIFGVVFIFIMKGSSVDLSKMSGIILLLVACVVFAGYSVLTRFVAKDFTPMEISYVLIGTGFIVMMLMSLTSHGLSGTWDALVTPFATPTFTLLIVLIGVIQIVTAFLASFVLARIKASQMTVFTNLSTVVSIVAGAVFLGEQVTWYHLIGSMLIVVGVIGATRFAGKKVHFAKTSTEHATALKS